MSESLHIVVKVHNSKYVQEKLKGITSNKGAGNISQRRLQLRNWNRGPGPRDRDS